MAENTTAQKSVSWPQVALYLIGAAVFLIVVGMFLNFLRGYNPSTSPFVEAAPPGHHFVGATKGAHGKSCEDRGGQIVPDTSKPLEKTAKGYRRPNKCTAD